MKTIIEAMSNPQIISFCNIASDKKKETNLRVFLKDRLLGMGEIKVLELIY